MSWITESLKNLSRQLYPKSRVFKMPPNGIFDRLDTALNLSEARAYNDATSILNSIIPDNANFTADDATQWEQRLAIITSAGTTLANRKLAILQKMAYPSNVAPRCAHDYIQDQLRLAGFDVYVYENRFWNGSAWVTHIPSDILGIPVGMAELDAFELGEVDLDEYWSTAGVSLVANSLSETVDAEFVIYPNWNSTFYIAGATISTFATVPISRRAEFRQLILQLKPQQTVGILFVNYI